MDKEEIDWLELEQEYRQALSDRYTSYMSSASSFELNMLAALVDGRYNNRSDGGQKYSTRTREDCRDDILFKIEEYKK